MPGQGELWRGDWGIGLESVYGDPVAATRKLYVRSDSVLQAGVDPRNHHFAVNRRDNRLGVTHGPLMPGGNVNLPIDPDEVLELLAITIGTPVTVGTTHTFTPGSDAPSSATIEYSDAVRAWQIAGVYGNTANFRGSANGELILAVELFGKGFDPITLTGGLDERVPNFLEGWQTLFYLDDLGDTPGATVMEGLLVNWDVTFNNQLQRKFTADNFNGMRKAVLGELDVTARLVIEASEDVAEDELNHYLTNDAGRMMRLRFVRPGGTVYLDLDMPGRWAAADLGQGDAGTRVYGMDLSYVYSPDDGWGFQATAVSTRSSLF